MLPKGTKANNFVCRGDEVVEMTEKEYNSCAFSGKGKVWIYDL